MYSKPSFKSIDTLYEGTFEGKEFILIDRLLSKVTYLRNVSFLEINLLVSKIQINTLFLTSHHFVTLKSMQHIHHYFH